MEVFATPTFQAAHSARGGSPFAILTASQQAILYNAFDESVTAFYNHLGSISNNDRTDDNIEVLYNAIRYLISSLVSPRFLLVHDLP